MTLKVPFIDFKAQQELIREDLDERMQRIYSHARFVLGPEILELESELQRRAKVKKVVACANGTDALYLLLLAEEIGPGDAVFIPSFTFAATAAVVVLCGATPFFTDILDDFTIDPKSLKQAIIEAREKNLKPKAVITVDLYGLPADYDAISEITLQEKILLFIDAAQSFGARYKGENPIALGDGAITSFFPTKPLACYGDGGAVFTQSEERAHKVRMIANHGQVIGKRYSHKFVGINSRLDSMQAAVLLAKLKIFEKEVVARQAIADTYTRLLKEKAVNIVTPYVPDQRVSVWAQYTIRSQVRDKICEACSRLGVASIVHYPSPLNKQVAYKNYPSVSAGTPLAEKAAREVLSLPMHPYLEEKAQQTVVEAIITALSTH